MDSLPAGERAWLAGVERIECCAHLDLDGLTPEFGELRALVQLVDIPVFAMVRPRPGDFTVSPGELDTMLHSIDQVRDAGAQGIVLGVLNTDGSIDAESLARLVHAAGKLPVTFHRAFDSIANPRESLELLVETGVTRLLTSGDAASAWEGRALLRDLVQQAGTRIKLMPGGGVRNGHARELIAFTGAEEIHSSVMLDLTDRAR